MLNHAPVEKNVYRLGALGITLLLGLCLPGLSRAAEATTPPSAAAPASTSTDTASTRLLAIEIMLAPARQSLSGARIPEHGGYVEKGLASIDQTLAEVAAAKTYIKDHPDADKLLQPQATGNAQMPAFPDIPAYDRTAQGTYRSPAMVNTLIPLKTALQTLFNGPAGSTGGSLGELDEHRDKIAQDLVQAGKDVVAGMDYYYNVYSQANAPVTNQRAGRGGANANRGNANRGNAAANRGNRGANAPNAQPLSDAQMNALVLVEGDVMKGSGFTAKIGDQFYLITNLHVLSGQGNFTLTGMDGTKYPTNGPLFASDDADIAFLSIPQPAYYFEIMDDVVGGTKVNDAVAIPGNSAGAGVETQINGKLLALGPKLVEVDAHFVAGNSGSPILHRPTGKVIGVATYALGNRIEDLQSLLAGPRLRWFGFRLDVAKQLQPLDWQKFQAEGAQLKKIKDTTHQLINLLEGGDPGLNADTDIKNAYTKYLADRDQAMAHKKDSELASAAQRFSVRLCDLTDPALKNFQQEKLYAWHASQAKDQETQRTAIFKDMQEHLVASAHMSGFGNP